MKPHMRVHNIIDQEHKGIVSKRLIQWPIRLKGVVFMLLRQINVTISS